MKKQAYIKLPLLGRLILKYLLPNYDYEYVIGAFEQGFQDMKDSFGKTRALLWFWWQVGLSIPPLIKQKSTGGITMLISYFKTTVRNFLKNKAFSFINIFGLAIGMACCLLILLWVQDELGFDRFHKKGEQIYRITTTILTKERLTRTVGSPAPLGQTLVKEFPEVENACRVQSGWDGWRLHYGEKYFFNEKLAAVDPSFFEIFTFEFVKGNPKTALPDKHSIVITEEIARKCFGTDEPLGKILKMSNHDMKVTGVIKNVPKNSHIQFDYAFSAENMRQWRESKLDSWEYLQFATYIQLHPQARQQEVCEKINKLVSKNFPTYKVKFGLQPLKRIHLRSTPYDSWMVVYSQRGDINSVYIFSLVALSILLLACINYMNLSTARSLKRVREVGIRKVVGASRKNIFGQYMGESLLLTLFALLAALIFLNLMIPSFNTLSGKSLSLNQAGSMPMVIGLLLVTLFTGFLAGSYPALFLSAFRPIRILQKDGGTGSRTGFNLRRILVIIQFAFTIGLIITSTVIYRQMHFIKHKDLGFNRDHIITFYSGHIKPELMKEKLSTNTDILQISYSQAPRQILYGNTDFHWQGKDPGDNIMFYPVSVDYQYLDTFKVKMVQGRFYSEKFTTDAEKAVVINETAGRAMGMENPLGKQVTHKGNPRVIIGVIKDFHMSSLHHPIEPMIFLYSTDFHHICAKIRPQNVDKTLKHIQGVWKSLVKDLPFEYEFLDDTINNFYKKERKTATLVLYATILALAIALLGLFGLASHTSEQRTKEIGIRKVLGASIPEIILLLIKDITRWFLLSNLVAWPVAYLITKKWVQNFAYHPGISLWIFLLSAAIALAVAVLTVIHQVSRAASRNPVNCLRYE